MSDEQTWRALAGLVTEDPSVNAAIERYVTDPDGYFAEHEDDLAQRGIEDVAEVSGVIVLIDALQAVGEVAYLDWKSPVDDVVGLVERLPRVKASGVDLKVLLEIDTDPGVEKVVGHANALLSTTDVRITILDEDSDAYPLIAVSPEVLERLIGTAARVAVEVRVPSDEPAAIEALRAADGESSRHS